MGEEITAIRAQKERQRSAFWDLRSNLEPCTFKVTTRNRCVHYDAESKFFKGLLRQTKDREAFWDQLSDRSEHLNTSLVQMLKVSDENSSNAIMVFTIVATVFLPLSWATSYLGMNTSDIRDLQQGQWLFWTIAGPVAALVIGVALTTALKGEAIREYFIQRRRHIPTRYTEPRQEIIRTSTMMSAVMGSRKEKDIGNQSWARLRRKRQAKKEGDV